MRAPIAFGLFAAGFLTLATLDTLRPQPSAIPIAADTNAPDPWFTTERNAEIELSLWLYEGQRRATFIAERNAEIETSMAASAERHTAEFIAARNAEIETAMALSEDRRMAEFATARNAEIVASIEASDRRRELEFAAARNSEIDLATAATERRQLAEFTAARNAEIETATAAVEQRRTIEFAAARNREIDLAIAATERRQLAEFTAARNREIDLAMAATEERQLAEFTAARNREIDIAIAATERRQLADFAAARNLEIDVLAAAAAIGHRPGIITGTLAARPAPATAPAAAIARTPGAEACLDMGASLAAVRFAPGASRLSVESRAALDDVARIAATCASVEIEIHGHSDAAGSERANQRLSELRARAVARYLIAAGIDQRRLITIGHGAGQPIVPNDTAENRALNRRIEFSLRERPSTLSSFLGSI